MIHQFKEIFNNNNIFNLLNFDTNIVDRENVTDELP